MATVVADDPAKSRYELFVDDELVGFALYELGPGRITVAHVEVEPQRSGHGLGRVLVDEMLADVRRRRLDLVPACPFTRKVVAENQAAYLDLVPADVREEFDLPS
jgi:uncharacterized protein